MARSPDGSVGRRGKLGQLPARGAQHARIRTHQHRGRIRVVMLGVGAGGDRQTLHEVIRRHSLEVARAVAEEGAGNDLLARLAADPAFGAADIAAVARDLDPLHHCGRAPEQVQEFLRDVVVPLLGRLADAPTSEVRV